MLCIPQREVNIREHNDANIEGGSKVHSEREENDVRVGIIVNEVNQGDNFGEDNKEINVLNLLRA